jgi:HK97 family phage prohead protease
MHNSRKQANSPQVRYAFCEQSQARVVSEESRTIRGYGVVFNKPSVQLRIAGKICREIIRPEAVTGVDLSRCLSMHNHDANRLLGNAEAGTMRTGIDEIGVWYEVDLPNSPTGEDVLESVKRGDTKGSSFQFDLAANGSTMQSRDGVLIHEVTQFGNVYEMGPVTTPAYPDTTASKRLKSLKSLRDAMYGDSDMDDRGEGGEMPSAEEMMEPYWQIGYMVSMAAWSLQELNYVISCANEQMETIDGVAAGGTANAGVFSALMQPLQDLKSAAQKVIDGYADSIKTLNNSPARSADVPNQIHSLIEARKRDLDLLQVWADAIKSN